MTWPVIVSTFPLRRQRGLSVTDVEVLRVNLTVLGQVVVFLSHEHSLAEEILVDLLAVSFWDEPGVWSV